MVVHPATQATSTQPTLSRDRTLHNSGYQLSKKHSHNTGWARLCLVTWPDRGKSLVTASKAPMLLSRRPVLDRSGPDRAGSGPRSTTCPEFGLWSNRSGPTPLHTPIDEELRFATQSRIHCGSVPRAKLFLVFLFF